MTYNVFGGTLSLTQLINQSYWSNYWHAYTCSRVWQSYCKV